MILVVDHKTSKSKDVEESDNRFAIVKTLVQSLVKTIANDASVLNKACGWHCFGPKVERKVGKF